MDKISNILKAIGLTDTESNIYLTGLGYSTVGVSELEKQTQIKRTTIYHALDTLLTKGLVSKKGTGSRLVFTMTKPDNVERLIAKDIARLEQQKKELKEIIPLLNQRLIQSESDVKISHFEGVEGMKLVIEEALYSKSRHWDIIAPRDNFFSQFDRAYAKYFIETRKARGLTARSLWEGSRTGRLLAPEEIKMRNPRYLPEIMHGKFKSVIILFDDKAAFITSIKELSAVLIQSEDMISTLRAMFDGLWHISKEYK